MAPDAIPSVLVSVSVLVLVLVSAFVEKLVGGEELGSRSGMMEPRMELRRDDSESAVPKTGGTSSTWVYLHKNNCHTSLRINMIVQTREGTRDWGKR